MNDEVFLRRESNVRSYCRSFPEVFVSARGALVRGESGREYIDFFAGAGTLNYGHNPPFITERLVRYLEGDGIIHALDMHTVAKREFLTALEEVVLRPRGLDYKAQFCSPSGTNAVEAALKLARKVTNRTGVFAFMGGYHGMSLGSLAVTGNKFHRAAAGVPLGQVTFMPYPHGFMGSFDGIEYIEAVLSDSSSGIEKPAAMLVETVQAEGGIVVAPVAWLKRLAALCERHEILLICDEVQVGCGRTGPFFSFERAGLRPDLVVLSKAISGCGTPMAMVLIGPGLDRWAPGEHSGTFRGNQLGFVAGEAGLRYWEGRRVAEQVKAKEGLLRRFLEREMGELHAGIEVRGIGMIWGVDVSGAGGVEVARDTAALCFERGLILERSGRNGQVLKVLPPLTIDEGLLEEGCARLAAALKQVLSGGAGNSRGREGSLAASPAAPAGTPA